jgi:hypothetical protein
MQRGQILSLKSTPELFLDGLQASTAFYKYLAWHKEHLHAFFKNEG